LSPFDDAILLREYGFDAEGVGSAHGIYNPDGGVDYDDLNNADFVYPDEYTAIRPRIIRDRSLRSDKQRRLQNDIRNRQFFNLKNKKMEKLKILKSRSGHDTVVYDTGHEKFWGVEAILNAGFNDFDTLEQKVRQAYSDDFLNAALGSIAQKKEANKARRRYIGGIKVNIPKEAIPWIFHLFRDEMSKYLNWAENVYDNHTAGWCKWNFTEHLMENNSLPYPLHRIASCGVMSGPFDVITCQSDLGWQARIWFRNLADAIESGETPQCSWPVFCDVKDVEMDEEFFNLIKPLL
jgi:hypothetical protein